MALFELCDFAVGELVSWDVSIEAGECISLSGPSGSGKSRLLRAMADLDPHQGEARLEGGECRDYESGAWRRHVGLLPAESAWWCSTIGEHFARPPETAALTSLTLGGTCMSWEVSRCSTGERQRLALLRLLANRPRVLLLDEPTASLDPTNVSAVEALISEYLQETGAAAIWVGHDPGQRQRMARRHYWIQDGRVVVSAA